MSMIKKSRESTTLQFVLVANVILFIKYAGAGLTIAGMEFPAMSTRCYNGRLAATRMALGQVRE
jgi:hypothetical protein